VVCVEVVGDEVVGGGEVEVACVVAELDVGELVGLVTEEEVGDVVGDAVVGELVGDVVGVVEADVGDVLVVTPEASPPSKPPALEVPAMSSRRKMRESCVEVFMLKAVLIMMMMMITTIEDRPVWLEKIRTR